ncbi:MAG: tetratricopeptide repeat protein [Chitinophagales bacterium]|nr:tetratricopeptide repeat protein [Chitinophagales bacterium]
MKKTNSLSLVPLLTAFFILFGCSSGKEVATAQKSQAQTVTADLAPENQAAQEAYIDGIKAKMLEDHEEAVKQFQKSLKLDPQNHGAYYELAFIFFRMGDFDQSLRNIKEAVRLDPANKWYSLLYAEVLSYKGQFMEAAGVYERLLKQSPNELELYFDWAFMLVKAEKLEEAVKVYDQYESKFGLDPEVIAQKQRLYVRMGKIDKAASEVRKLINSDPSEPSYYKMLADLYEANDMKDKAAKVYEELLQIDKDNPNAMLYFADMYRMKGQNDLAMEYLKKAFSNPQLSIDAKVRILFPYLQQLMSGQQEKREEAFMLAQLLIETHPGEAKAHAIYGDMLYQDKQMEDALAQYEQALEIDSSVFEVWQQLFFIHNELRQYEELEKTTASALELFPSQPLVYFFNGISKNQLKKYKDAVEILSLGEALVVENPLLKSQMLSSLGEAYNYLEDYANSDSSFEKALLFDGDNSYTLNNYAYYLSLRSANLERAKEMSFKSIQLVPGNASFEDTYAWILYKMEDYKGAREWIEKAIENTDEESPVLLEHYGDILFKLGEVDKAVSYWQKAKSLGSESELIGKKIADKKMYE